MSYKTTILCLVLVLAARQAGARKMLDYPHMGDTNVQQTQEYTKYSNAGDGVLQNEAQQQASTGVVSSNNKIFTVADSRRVTEQTSDTRNMLNGNDAHALVGGAADGDESAAHAAKENQNLSQLTSYGHGLNLDASNRAAIANTDAQRAIQKNLDTPAIAAAAGSNAAWATTFTASNQWAGNGGGR